MEGWIKLHRGAKYHWVFKDPQAWKIWCYILMDATHRQSQRRVRGRIVQLYAGQTIFGRPEWEKILNIDGSKIYRVVQQFADANMITLFSVGRHYSIITVCNWSVYQSEYGEHQNGQQDEQQNSQENEQPQDLQPQDIQGSNGQQKELQNGTQKDNKRTYNKNVKNVNNEKKDNISSEIFSHDSIEYRLANGLRERILNNNKKTRVPDDKGMQKWASEIDKMIRLDERTENEINQVIIFSQKDNFWKTNILSATKLREKFDTLFLQSQRNGGVKGAKSGSITGEDNTRQDQYDGIGLVL